MKNLFEEWLINNSRPRRYSKTIITISNDLKKNAYTNFDLYKFNNPIKVKEIKDYYFKIDEYYLKNFRGHNMYSSAFDRYIEFLEDTINLDI